ncbi:MAG: hypothetical protein LBV16_06985 [Elusimicrobiota bacterium]|jgi:hypothetical protein|nr:hypothetical protein [Elusimicrobiota bacterium]
MQQIPIHTDGKPEGEMSAFCLCKEGNGAVLETIGLTEGQIQIEMTTFQDNYKSCADDDGNPLIITPTDNLIVELENAPYYIRAMYDGAQDASEITIVLRRQ